MQIIDGQTDEAALSKMGYDAVRLLCSGEIGVLAARFGYALAFGREPQFGRTWRIACINLNLKA